jgi:hypothetical protein
MNIRSESHTKVSPKPYFSPPQTPFKNPRKLRKLTLNPYVRARCRKGENDDVKA